MLQCVSVGTDNERTYFSSGTRRSHSPRPLFHSISGPPQNSTTPASFSSPGETCEALDCAALMQVFKHLNAIDLPVSPGEYDEIQEYLGHISTRSNSMTQYAPFVRRSIRLTGSNDLTPFCSQDRPWHRTFCPRRRRTSSPTSLPSRLQFSCGHPSLVHKRPTSEPACRHV